MLLTDFEYELPEELIAQHPAEERSASRMLVVDRARNSWQDSDFRELPAFLRAGDLVVLNNTKVFPARIFGKTETGARIELFLIRETEDGSWETLARPGRRLKTGTRIDFGDRLTAEVLEKSHDGRVFVKLQPSGDLNTILDSIGRTPLPPYIKRGAGPDSDRERYQTVFAKNSGAIAAPTAGLHFTDQILQDLHDSGIGIAEITLHVGYGTFEPIRTRDLSQHRVLPERFEISEEAAGILNRAVSEKRRIISIGTTTARALESAADESGMIAAGKQLAQLTITPGYEFRITRGLLTNFHLPRSSLLLLVSTFGGYRLIMDAYRHAVASRYRFYSYGDCMLVL